MREPRRSHHRSPRWRKRFRRGAQLSHAIFPRYRKYPVRSRREMRARDDCAEYEREFPCATILPWSRRSDRQASHHEQSLCEFELLSRTRSTTPITARLSLRERSTACRCRTRATMPCMATRTRSSKFATSRSVRSTRSCATARCRAISCPILYRSIPRAPSSTSYVGRRRRSAIIASRWQRKLNFIRCTRGRRCFLGIFDFALAPRVPFRRVHLSAGDLAEAHAGRRTGEGVFRRSEMHCFCAASTA